MNALRRKSWENFALILFVFVHFISCKKAENKVKDQRGNSTYIRYAKGLQIDTIQSATRICLGMGEAPSCFELVPVGNEGVPSTIKLPQIQIPVSEFMVSSSSHVALFEAIDAIDQLVGLPMKHFLWSEAARERIDSELAIELGLENEINVEQILEAAPGILMLTSHIDPHREASLREGETIVIANSEWKELHPLGRAEWIKLVGILSGKKTEADSVFDAVERAYLTKKKMIQEKIFASPLVLSGSAYKGTWYVPGGKSFMAQLIEDAGGDYIWKSDQNQASLPKDFEEVYAHAIDAKVWLIPGTSNSRHELLGEDARFGDFDAMNTGRVYVSNLKVGAGRGNDYYESGVIRPDKILGDLIHIFHPEISPNQDMNYFQAIQ